MIKKIKWLGIFTVIAVVLTSGYTLFARANNTSPQTQQEAIDEGLEHLRQSGSQICGAALTPATHKATGAKYTFGSTCIPPGWEVDRH